MPLEAAVATGEILARIAVVLGLPLGSAEPLPAIRDRLARGKSLLLLDNFEHLTPGAAHLTELLEACPATSVVVTSREPLGLASEVLNPVGGLSVPATAAVALEGGRGDDAFHLYLLAARRYDPRFAVDEGTVEAVLGICHLLEGAPLAIELAAALARVISPGDLVQELAANLDTLVRTQPSVSERHASLRAVFEHSWMLLGEVERAALAGSSVFLGGFSRRAAAAVLGMDMRLLSVLLDRSLLRRDGTRYDLHPLVKQYAGEKLAQSTSAAEVQARYAEYYCRLLESKQEFYMRAGQRAAFEEVNRDLANVRSAWLWAASAGRQDLLERMAPMLKDFLIMRERSDLLASLMEEAWPKVDPDSLVAARILHAQARVLAARGAVEGVRLYERALALARRHGAGGEVPRLLMELGSAHFNHGDLGAARERWLEALPLLEREYGGRQLGGCLANLSLVTDDGPEHERLLLAAIAACRQSGNTAHLASVLHNYAVFVSTGHGDYAHALALENEAIALEQDETGRALILANLHKYAGYNLMQLGELAEAERQLAEVSRLLDGPEPTDDANARGRRRAEQFLLPHLHYARGEIELARAAAENAPDDDKNSALLAWMAVYAGDAAEAEFYRCKLLTQAEQGSQVPRYVRHDRAVAHLLSAEVAALKRTAGRKSAPSAALAELVAALRIITSLGFVPLALDAFVTAYAVTGATTGTELLQLAATHPAAEYRTRRRATQLLGTPAVRAAVAGAARGRGVGALPSASPSGPTAILDLARALATRLRAPEGLLEVTPRLRKPRAHPPIGPDTEV